MKRKIKYTPKGYSYVDVSLEECLNWGGLGICNDCGAICGELKLIWALRDTYCNKCFDKWLERSKNYLKEDIEHDLKLQREQDVKWYEYHMKWSEE